MSYPAYQFNLMESIVLTFKENGHTEVYRHKALEYYSRIMCAANSIHTPKTRGEHICPILEKIAQKHGGVLIKDLNKNGNTKKKSVRIKF